MLVVLNHVMDRRTGLTPEERRDFRPLYGDPWRMAQDLLGHTQLETTKAVYLSPVTDLQLRPLLADFVPADGPVSEQELTALTATAGCADYDHSPFSPAGQGCTASFLLCTACPNARVTPAHHPRLAHLHQALGNLRGVLEPAVWEADWADAHARLDDLCDRLGRPVWEAAVGDSDRHVIEHLLHGDYEL